MESTATMTSVRFLTAMVLAACALVASVLVAIPTDGPDLLAEEALRYGTTASIPQATTNSDRPTIYRPATEGSTAYRPATRALQPTDESHGALPRIWLGGAR
jgi:DNA gyrase inhibitor GyrI